MIGSVKINFISSDTLSILITIVFLSLYCLSGMLILRSTNNVWTDYASVAALSVILYLGVIFGRNGSVNGLVLIPFYPILYILERTGIALIIGRIIGMIITPLVPSLLAWFGMMISKRG